MAFTFARQKAITLPAGHSVKGATADDDGIYLLTYKGGDPHESLILTYTKEGGDATATVTTFANQHNRGLVRVGNQWSYLTGTSPIYYIRRQPATSGGSSNIIAMTTSTITYLSGVFGLHYDADNTNYRIFYRTTFGAFIRVRSAVVTSGGRVGRSVVLPAGFGMAVAGLTYGDDKYWQIATATQRNVYTLDDNLAAVSETNTMTNLGNAAVRALAWLGHELIAVTDDNFYFYTAADAPPEPMPTPTPTPVTGGTQQLFLPQKYYQRFDVFKANESNPSTGATIKSVTATNVNMIHQTELSTEQIIPHAPFVRDINEEWFIPKFTIPSVEIGDFIQINTTGNTAPTVVGDEFWKVNLIREIGDHQRQVFVYEDVIS